MIFKIRFAFHFNLIEIVTQQFCVASMSGVVLLTVCFCFCRIILNVCKYLIIFKGKSEF